jgi:hypothetical protein
MQPKFNSDFTKLAFFGSRDKFLSHTTNFELRYLDWPLKEQQES